MHIYLWCEGAELHAKYCVFAISGAMGKHILLRLVSIQVGDKWHKWDVDEEDQTCTQIIIIFVIKNPTPDSETRGKGKCVSEQKICLTTRFLKSHIQPKKLWCECFLRHPWESTNTRLFCLWVIVSGTTSVRSSQRQIQSFSAYKTCS